MESLKSELCKISEAEFSPTIDSAQALLEECQAALSLLKDSRESLSQQIDDAYSKAYYQEEQATIWRRRKATFPSRLQEQLSAKTSAEENLPIKELAKAQACQALEDAKELPIPDEHPDRSYNYLTSVRIYKQETASIDKEIKSLELQTEKLFETYQKESAVAQSFTADSQNIEGVGKGSMNSLRKLENDIKSMQLKLDSLQSKKIDSRIRQTHHHIELPFQTMKAKFFKNRKRFSTLCINWSRLNKPSKTARVV